MTKENQETLKAVEICFGAIFEHTFEGTTTQNVICWVGENGYCEAHYFNEKNGEIFVNLLGGTTTLSDIHKMLDRKLSLDQIIKGMQNCLGRQEIPEEILRLLTKYSVQPPRILTE